MTDFGEGPSISKHEAFPKTEQAGPKEMLLTPDHLLSLFTSEKFTHALGIAATETNNSGRETSFNAVLLPTGEPLIDAVVKGGGNTAAYDEFIADLDGHTGDIATADLFGFHFHPNETDVIVPSPTDLHELVDADSQKNGLVIHSPYVGVGQVSPGGDVSIRVIQKPTEPLTDANPDAYYTAAIGANSEQKLEETLLAQGFTSCLIHFKNTPSGLRLTKDSGRVLKERLGHMRVMMGDMDEKMSFAQGIPIEEL